MDIVGLCLDFGATKAEEILVSKLVLMPELREYCKQNACGKYGNNYTCPPHVGEIDTLIDKIKGFQKVVIMQNIYPLEDSFDFEGMMEAKNAHDKMTYEIADMVYDEIGYDNTLVLGAGSCILCELCGVETGVPCPNPQKSLSSLEAYGINVSKIEEISDMKYINGADTVTYFTGIFLIDN